MSSKITRPVTTSSLRSFISGFDFHVCRGLRLAGEDHSSFFVSGLQSVLDRHRHLAGQQFYAAGPAGADAAGVVDLNTNLVRYIENYLVRRQWRGLIRH